MVCSSIVLVVGVMLRARLAFERPSRIEVFGLVAAGGGMVLTVALTEIVLRLVPGAFGPEIRQLMQADVRNYGVADPYIGYLHRPNHTTETTGRDFHSIAHVDGLGFRNATWPWPARADIVTVGDSLTFGYGSADDESWPAVLAKAMSPARLINLGLIGAGPQQYQRLYETFGVKLQPKLLVVGFFGQNDFWDAGMFDQWQAQGAEPNYMIWRDFGRPVRMRFSLRDPLESLNGFGHAATAPIVRRSYLYHLLRALRDDSGRAGERPRVLTFSDGGRVQVFEGELQTQRALARPERRQFQLAVQALRDIAVETQRQGTHLLVVLQPGKEEVYLPGVGQTMDDTTSALRPALDRLGIDYLDLGPAFREHAAAGERLFHETDGHPNAAGYALTARVVAARIEAHAARYGLIAGTPGLGW
jgi:lysophospholipase L1-like esterase